ncbi:ATP-binding protein [Bacillus rubiinfantis]|uniref:ATP-binding protein n=1 Tax=Bacillus rubiinfantis TaxID=1499680 RepID=UPI0005AA2CAE|nr:ATP-binding protein [Bacillus rubiinfantis]
MEIEMGCDDVLPQMINAKVNEQIHNQECQQRYKRIFEDSIDGLILWDYQSRIVDINLAGEKLFHRSKKKLIGHFVYEPFNYQEQLRHEIIQHIENTLKYHHYTSTIAFHRKGGRSKYIECNSKVNITEGLNFTVFKDVTEKVELQEQLLKSETLHVIGELAAGIAHEIRNPMTALKGFIQLLEGSIKSEHAMYYQVITTELQRIDTIINEFLLLAKPQEIKYQKRDIKLIMGESIEILHAHALLHNVQFVTYYEDGLQPIFCEPNQLKKVFINLLKNAIEVMPKGGTISVSIKSREQSQIYISIKDEGSGISQDSLNKLGKPFYTTKERGTGLGLMVSYKIIEEHKGTVIIESEEGKGSIFHITLPTNLDDVLET